MELVINVIKKNINEIIIFSIYIFCFLLIEQVINDGIVIKLGNDVVLLTYSISIISTGLGYVSLCLLNKLKIRKELLNFLMRILFILSFFLNFISKGYLCILFSALSTFSFGYIGAYVHWKISESLFNSKKIGEVIGISTSFALILQMLIYNSVKNEGILISIIVFMSFFLFKKISDFRVVPSLKEEYKINKINILIPIITVAIISIIVGIQDSIITSMDSMSHINVYGIPRIFYILGVFAAGFIADKKEGKYLGICTIISVLIAICGIVFLQFETFYMANSSLTFLAGGFYVMYLTVKFMVIAPHTNNPTLWSGMGRIVRSFITGLVVIPTDFVFKKYGTDALIIVSIMFSALLIITLYKELTLVISKKQELNIEEFISGFKLTPKEKEVCELILKENKKTKEISKILYISERSVQRHLTSIYQKTKTSSRNELYKLYYNI